MNVTMQHIFSSMWNAKAIVQSPDTTRRTGGLSLVVDIEKNRSFTVIKSIAIELDVNTIIGDVMRSQNSQSIQLLSSNDPTWVADWVSGALRG